jgi:hypothetical protein
MTLGTLSVSFSLRAKDFLWVVFCHDDLILFSIAGSTLTFEPQAQWLAASPLEEILSNHLPELGVFIVTSEQGAYRYARVP